MQTQKMDKIGTHKQSSTEIAFPFVDVFFCLLVFISDLHSFAVKFEKKVCIRCNLQANFTHRYQILACPSSL